MLNWLFGKSKKAELTEDELKEDKQLPTKEDFPQTEENLHLLRQGVLSDVMKADALSPQYIDWISSKEDCDASTETLPLVYVWGEQVSEEGVRYVLSVNHYAVAIYIEKYLHPLDPYFEETLQVLIEILNAISTESMQAAINKTGCLPSEICSGLQG